MSSIYERIEYLIKQKGLTKKAFCEQLNISTGNMGDWKRGKSTPGTHKLIEIGAFFHVSLDWLILGKSAAEVIRENGEEYFPGPTRQLNCHNEELRPEEEAFIEEYIEFTRYRKSRDNGEKS